MTLMTNVILYLAGGLLLVLTALVLWLMLDIVWIYIKYPEAAREATRRMRAARYQRPPTARR